MFDASTLFKCLQLTQGYPVKIRWQGLALYTPSILKHHR